MPNRIELTESKLKDNALVLSGSDANLEEGIIATGQMLVDSDHYAFVYVVEYKQEFNYLILPEKVWPDLKQALDKRLPVSVQAGNTTVQLTGIHDELSYLLGNIKDNANYGEEMEKKVSDTFL